MRIPRGSLAFVLLTLAATSIPAQTSRGVVRGIVSVRGAELSAPAGVHGGYCNDLPGQPAAQPGRIANALVMLDYQGVAEFPRTTLELEHVRCAFAPAVAVAPPGATLLMRNEDAIAHTLFLERDGEKRATVDLQVSREKKDRSILRNPGRVEIRCDAHDWMQATVWVLDHPYYAITANDGSFQLGLIPPGTYRLKVWHEALGVLEQDIVIHGDKVVSANFTFER